MLTWFWEEKVSDRRNPDKSFRLFKRGTALDKDVLPKNVDNGSRVEIMDKPIVKYFDLENNTWRTPEE